MRTDIYSYNNDNNNFLIELHTSGSKNKQLGDKFKAESERHVNEIINHLLNTNPEIKNFQRVVIDQNWKNIQLIDKNGNKTTQTIDGLKATVFLPAQSTTKAVATPILLASTDKTAKELYMPGGFIEKGFRPVTPMEKIWKFFSNLSMFISGVAAKQGKSVGGYDFAVMFFSKDATRKDLEKEELKTSLLLDQLCDFFDENGMSTAGDKASIRQASEWAKQIENLRSQSGGNVASKFQKLAKEMHEEVKKLKEGESSIIPISSYQDAMGLRLETLRLMKITAHLVDGRKEYKIEFIDNGNNRAIDQLIPEKKLNSEDFFKPLIDIQLPVSFHEEAKTLKEILQTEDRDEKLGAIKGKVIGAIFKFAKRHPKIIAWMMIGKTREEGRGLFAALFRHAEKIGILPAQFGAEKTSLAQEDLAKIFANLLPDSSDEYMARIFRQENRLLSKDRMIDSLLPLAGTREDQAKTEAKSLFQFYYLFEQTLGDDPAILTILEEGIRRISSLYLELEIFDPRTNEMLKVIRNHIDEIQKTLHQNHINTNERINNPSLPDKFQIPIPGKAFNNKKLGKASKAKPPEMLPPMNVDENPLQRREIDAKNRKLLLNVDALTHNIAKLDANLALLDNLKQANKDYPLLYLNTVQKNLRNFGKALKLPETNLANAENYATRLESLAVSLAQNQASDMTSQASLMNEYIAIIKDIREELKLQEKKLGEKLRVEFLAQKTEYEKIIKAQANMKEQMLQTLSALDKAEDIQNFIYYQMRSFSGPYPSSMDAYLIDDGKLTKVKYLIDSHSGANDLISPYFISLKKLKDTSLKHIEGVKTNVNKLLKVAEKTKSLTIDQLVEFREFSNVLTQIKTSSIAEDVEQVSGLIGNFKSSLEKTQKNVLEPLESYDKGAIDAHLKTLAGRITHCKTTYRGNLSPEKTKALRNEIDVIINQLPIENLEAVHSFWANHEDWKPNILALTDLIKLAHFNSEIDGNEGPGFLLPFTICNAILHRMDWQKLKAFNNTLSNVEKKLIECQGFINTKTRNNRKLTSAEKAEVKDQIDSIMAELPDAELNKSLWSRHKDFESKITNLIELTKTYSNKAQYGKKLKDIQEKLKGTYNPEMELLNRSPELSSEFLRYDTHLKQRQLHAVNETLYAYTNMPKSTPKAMKIYRNEEENTPTLRLQADDMPGMPVLDLEIENVAQKAENPSHNDAKRHFDNASTYLLRDYIHYEVDGLKKSEGDLRENQYEGYLKLTEDQLYLLNATNSSDPNVGLEQLIHLALSQDFLSLLNDDERKLGIQLRNVIMNRMLRPGHLETYLKDAERAENILKDLDLAIENSSSKYPESYVTYSIMKSTILVFLKEHPAQIDKANREIETLIQAIGKKIYSNEPTFAKSRLQLHALRLKVYTTSYISDPKLQISKQNLSELLDSWFAYNSSPLNYTNKQEDEGIRQFFDMQVLPAWNKLSTQEKKDILTGILKTRKEIEPSQTPSWNGENEFFTASLNNPVPQTCEVDINKGTLKFNGVGKQVGGGNLPLEYWNRFPLNLDTTDPQNPINPLKPLNPVKLENTEPSVVYEFKIYGYGQTLFQMEILNDKATFSIQLLEDDGKAHWYQYSDVTPQDKVIDVEPEKMKRFLPKGIQKLKEMVQKLKALIEAIKEPIVAPIKEIKEKFGTVGKELAKKNRSPEKESSVPKEIPKNGVWIDKSNHSEGLMIDKSGNKMGIVKISHTRKRKKDGSIVYTSRVKSITKRENGTQYHLVNNPKSSLYNQLSGLTKSENIKMWADSKGVIQKIELSDPKMSFQYDPVTKKLKSDDLEGFYIANDQSLPIGDFSSEWKNYMILTNDAGERRLIMRQSAILDSFFLTETGFKPGVLLGQAEKKEEIFPYIDIRIVEHSERGFKFETNKPQGNLYLALANIQSGNYENAVAYLRLAARSANYSKIEIDLIKALFGYKSSSFIDLNGLSAGDPFDALTKVIEAMQLFEINLPSLAAMKLTTLAVLLEQDLTSKDIEFPTAEEVKKWLTIYHLPNIPGLPLNTVSSGAKLTTSELRRIYVKYPDAESVDIKRAGLAYIELFPLESEKMSLESDKLRNRGIESIGEYDEDREVVKKLSSTKQIASKENIMTFYAGKYVISHFKDLYERIDALDGSKKTADGSKNPDRTELRKITKQLSRFKDTNSARVDAIKFLLSLALHKLDAGLKPNEIQIAASKQALLNHISNLNEHRADLISNYDNLLNVLKGSKRDTEDLIPAEELEELQKLIASINDVEIEMPEADKLDKFNVKEIETFAKGAETRLYAIMHELNSRLAKLAAQEGVLISDAEDIKKPLPAKKQKKATFNEKELEEIDAWRGSGMDAPHPRSLQKIQLTKNYTLLDHLNDPEKYPLPKRYSNVRSVLVALEFPDKRLFTFLPKNKGHSPKFTILRSEWQIEELVAINKAIEEMKQSARLVGKLGVVTSFPKPKKDSLDTNRVVEFLNSHSEIVTKKSETRPEIIEKSKTSELNLDDLNAAIPDVELERIIDSDKAKGVYEAAKSDYNQAGKVHGYFTPKSFPFFDKLNGDQLVEFDKIYTSAKINPLLQKTIINIIENEKFNTRILAFELLKNFIASTDLVMNPKGIEEECERLTKEINLKDVSMEEVLKGASIEELLRKSPPLRTAERGAIHFEEKGIPVLKQSTTLKHGVRQNELKAALAEVTASAETKKQKVDEKRLEILELANKLPSGEKARSAEELRRFQGGASTVDIETIFRLFAQDKFEDLKKINPSLTDEDISFLTEAVTLHHISAIALQTLNRQIQNCKSALALREKFELLATDSKNTETIGKLNDGLKDFFDIDTPTDSKKLNDLIDELSQGGSENLGTAISGYTKQQFSDDIREFRSLVQAFNENAGTKRFYDSQFEHPHTRAALAYEYTLEKVFRDDQIKEFTARVGTPDIVSWLGTGFGKTFMAPGLAKMMATGTNLVTIIDTKDLIPTTSKSRDQDSRAVYGQAAYHFQFSRDPDRPLENLKEMEYRLLNCINNSEYIVTSKESLGSLVLQLLTWQRMGVEDGRYDAQIEVTQRIISLFRDRGVALGDEIHLILNAIEALDYAEGERKDLKEYAEFYETISSMYSAIYPSSSQDAKNPYTKRSNEIANLLKISENRQAQVNKHDIQKAMVKLADLMIDQSVDAEVKPKDKMQKILNKIIKAGVKKEDLINFLTVSEASLDSGEALLTIINDTLDEKEKLRLGTLKENLSSSFEKVMKKIGDDDFGITSDHLGICPYNKGRPWGATN